jgi:hypothetical protein
MNSWAKRVGALVGVGASLAGVVLTVLLAAGWWRSGTMSDAACWRLENDGLLIRTVPGRLRLVFVRNCGWDEEWLVGPANPTSPDSELWQLGMRNPIPPNGSHYGHFAVESGEQATGRGGAADSAYFGAVAPFWTWMLVPGFPSVVYLFLRSRKMRKVRNRQRLGLCQKCGYDLRASRERCPECGHAAEPPPTAHRGFRRKTGAAQT